MENVLRKIKIELLEITRKVGPGAKLTLGWDLLTRWRERVRKVIEANFSKEELARFEGCAPKDFSAAGNYYDLVGYVLRYDSYLEALIEDTKSTSDLRELGVLSVGSFSTLHSIIIEKCMKLYNDHSYAEAVEKSFKVVKDRLRELTSFEKGSDAFGNGHLHIKGAAAPNVDSDFNQGVKFLTMAIDMFRNEKSHTADANISDPVRAYEYLRLSSLAMNLLDGAEIKEK